METMQRIARQMLVDIRQQAPRRGNNPRNPYATGKLVRSIGVEPQQDGDQWSIIVSYDDYGDYTAFGTRQYFNPRDLQQSFFGLREFKGYEKGKGGIRPQYWLSLRGQRPKYERMIEEGLSITFETFTNNVISNLSKPRW